jgi:hypothetical protein
MVVVLMLEVGFSLGCHKKPAGEPVAAQGTPHKEVPISQLPPLSREEKKASVAAGGGNSAAMAVRRGIDRQKAQNYLENIKTWYHTYNAENGRSPAKLEDFLAYIKRDGQRETKALQDGLLTLQMNVPLSSNVVLAYETDPYTDGTRLVMFGDGHIQMMGAQEFQTALGNH